MTSNSSSSPLMSRLEAIRTILMAHHAAGVSFPNAAKGSERETLIREFFAKVQPNPTRFGSGAIIDSSGVQSGQLDIVAEFPFFPSFPTPAADERMYLAESVSFVVEVKSDLGSQWSQVESTTEKVRRLRRGWRGHLEFDAGTLAVHDASTSRIPIVAVGFEGFSSIDAIERRLNSTDEKKRPDAVLVVSNGIYVSTLTNRRACGAQGLFALCADMTYFALNVLTAQPNLDAYFGSKGSAAG
jgi:hypothetical protein